MSPRRKTQAAATASKAKAGMKASAEVVKRKLVGAKFDNFNVRKRSIFDRFNTKT